MILDFGNVLQYRTNQKVVNDCSQKLPSESSQKIPRPVTSILPFTSLLRTKIVARAVKSEEKHLAAGTKIDQGVSHSNDQ